MKNTKVIKIGNISIGGGSPIAIQSMTNTKTADKNATLAQIKSLSAAGCDIVRFTVNDIEAAEAIPYYVENSSIPLVADIHFDYKLALAAAERGIQLPRVQKLGKLILPNLTLPDAELRILPDKESQTVSLGRVSDSSFVIYPNAFPFTDGLNAIYAHISHSTRHGAKFAARFASFPVFLRL